MEIPGLSNKPPMAAQCCQLQLDTAAWISDIIYPIRSQKMQPSKVKREPFRYICLATDPTLQQRVEDAADSMDLTLSPEAEEQLVNNHQGDWILDCDVERLLSSDVIECPLKPQMG